jgi:hypothetical protein
MVIGFVKKKHRKSVVLFQGDGAMPFDHPSGNPLVMTIEIVDIYLFKMVIF